MCFLLAVALLGPLLAHLSATLLGLPLRGGGAGAAGSLAADNSRANSRRLASAITPIVMVTAFCGTLLFLQTTVSHVSAQQVRGGIVADQVLGSAGPGLPAGTADQAARLPGVDAAVGVLRSSALYRSGDTLASASVLGVSGDPARLGRVLDPGIRSGSLAALDSDDSSTTSSSATSVALDAQLAENLGVKVGDPVPFWLGDGTEVRPTVVATYQRGLGLGQVLLPRAALAGHVVAGFDNQVLVGDAPGADRGAVAAALAVWHPRTDRHRRRRLRRAGRPRPGDQQLGQHRDGGGARQARGRRLGQHPGDDRAGPPPRGRPAAAGGHHPPPGARDAPLGGAACGLDRPAAGRRDRLDDPGPGHPGEDLTGGSPYIPAGTAVPAAVGVIVLALAATALPGHALLRIRPVEAGAGKQ